MIARFHGYKLGYKTVVVVMDDAALRKITDDGLNALLIADGEAFLHPEGVSLTCCSGSDALYKLGNFDVCTIWDDGTLHRVYDDRSTDNYFFLSGKCNSNCIMCPTPERMRKDAPEISIKCLMDVARCIPTDARHLTITGGEPFLAGEEAFAFLRLLKGRFEQTEFLILTNGRVFSIERYADLLAEFIPRNAIVAIPLHGSCPEIHDAVTRAPGSFEQTRVGIKNLLDRGIRVELRMVVGKFNSGDFSRLANLVSTQFSRAEYVSVIALEMTGSARANKDAVWVPYRESFKAISEAVRGLVGEGMDVKLYNFPLCTVDRPFWTLCVKSISPSKVRFAEQCQDCRCKNDCGGVFAGTFNLVKSELKAIR